MSEQKKKPEQQTLVKLLTSVGFHKTDTCGRLIGISTRHAGDEVELPKSEAETFVERGYAVYPKKS